MRCPVYFILDSLFSGFYLLLAEIPYFWGTINWGKLLTSVVLATVIAALIAMNSVLFYIEYKKRKEVKKAGFLSSLGILGGFSTGVCAACISGLLPLIFSFFGITFSWAFLPFQGMEIQVLTIGILSLSLYLLTKKKTCKVNA